MKRARWFLTLLLAGMSFVAHAQEGIGFSEVALAPVVKDWDARMARLHQAELIELDARVIVAGQPERQVELVRTPAGTVGCLIDGKKRCQPLREMGLIDMHADQLLDLLTAQTAEGLHARTLPGASVCWALPEKESSRATQATFSQWSFNPEAGIPMPSHIVLKQNKISVRFEIERFLLRSPDSENSPQAE